MNILSVYYQGIMSMTDKSLVEVHEYSLPDRYWRQWEWCRYGYAYSIEAGEAKKAIESKWFKTRFVDHIAKGYYYQFIITKKQYACFLEDITNFDFIKYKVYESPRPAVNCNYPENGACLYVFLFYVPEE